MNIITLAPSGYGDNFANDSNFSSFSDNTTGGYGNTVGGAGGYDNNLSYGGTGRGILIKATHVSSYFGFSIFGLCINTNDIVTLWGGSVLLSHPSVIPFILLKPHINKIIIVLCKYYHTILLCLHYI